MQFKKLISVIIPTYNYANSLPRAISSVASQLTESSELIVIDDGSTDNTEQIIQNLLLDYPSKINYYKKRERRGSFGKKFGDR